MKTILLKSGVVFLLFASATMGAQYSAGLQTITVNGRAVDIQTPTDYNTSNSYPVLFALHPTGGSRASMGNQTLVDNHQYIGVYPEGETALGIRYFNAYKNAALSTGVDDVAFITDVYNSVLANANVYTDSVYVHGYSNGGIMAYKMARETTLFKGLSIRAGGEEVGDDVGAAAARIPILHVHGAQDQTVPFHGGASDLAPPFGSYTNFKTTVSTVKSWFIHNACNIRPSYKPTTVDAGLANEYQLWEYYDCNTPREKQMVFYSITNGGHNTSSQGFGYASIIDLSWAFFRNN